LARRTSIGAGLRPSFHQLSHIPMTIRAILRRPSLDCALLLAAAWGHTAEGQRTPRPTEKATPPALLTPDYDSSLFSSPWPAIPRSLWCSTSGA
jgi:hypothetical protein